MISLLICPKEEHWNLNYGHVVVGEEKYERNIVKQVVEPVNTMKAGRATIPAKRVLLDPEEYLQALYLRNLSLRNTFLHRYYIFTFQLTKHRRLSKRYFRYILHIRVFCCLNFFS